MPLPFLTATPSSHGDDERRRPYRPTPWQVGGAALLLLLAAYLLFSALIIVLAGSWPIAGVCLVVAAVTIAVALRLVRVGIRSEVRG
ncbi:hypothetical protein [Streptomyces sp. NPDC002537]